MSKRPNPLIIVHGGAGDWPQSRHREALKGVERAAKVGFDLLREGNTARGAVEGAIVVLEDNPIFNAGTGSTMNMAGQVENDAAIMDGRKLESGAVALVHGVKNPIKLARIVMEKTDHVLIAGRTTERLAHAYKLARASPIVPERLANWKRERGKMKRGAPRYFPKNLALQESGILATLCDTVGALTLDSAGNLAAGASTGGVTLKLPGRIGDSAIVGAGLYADNKLGAATATGIGELAIRTAISKTACDLMQQFTAQEASSKAVQTARYRVGNGLGIITLDRHGRFGISHTTKHLCWAVGLGNKIVSGMKGKRIEGQGN